MFSRRAALAIVALALIACSNQPQVKVPAALKPTPTPSSPAPAMLQIENSPDSLPHSGLAKADMAFEYLTEGGITRFTVVYFKPSGGDKTGPVRSARLVALRLVQSFHGVLFYSGASDFVQGKIWDSKLPNYTEGSDGGKYFTRDSSRRAPHNLFTTPDQMAQAVDKSGQRITYTRPAPGEPTAQGTPANKIDFAQTIAHHVSYTYDAGSKTYAYAGETDAANGNQPLKVTNVVLMQVPHHGAGYKEDVLGAEGIDFDLSGQGKAEVFTRGQRFDATWDLSQADQPVRILGADGKDFPLPQGLTWIHLVDPGLAASVS